MQDFRIISSLEEVDWAIEELGVTEAVIKVQVLAGGRGKAGGVKLAKSTKEIKEQCQKMLGMKITNEQTGPEGQIAHKLMISELCDIAKEYYLGLVVDRESAQVMLMASPEGGMDIEEIAAKHPDRILKFAIGLDGSIEPYRLDELASFMKWEGKTAKEGCDVAVKLAKAFIDNDASLLEINPLVESPDGEIFALDAKLGIDDNALFRHKEIAELYDPTMHPPAEVTAKEIDLAYIALEGEIGCMVNGAGLAMATMDLIKLHGGSPANFLDVGGSATKEKVAKGFGLILSDKRVRGVLVNIFGGIMKCDVIAEGVIAAVKEVGIKVPLVVRLEGTNVDQGRKLLEASGLKIIAVENLTEAAKQIVKAVKDNAHSH